MPTIQVPRGEMLDILEDPRLVVEDTIIGKSRWSIQHVMVFKRDGRFYRAYYSVGATENQDEGPFEYDDVVSCGEVTPVEVMTTKYQLVKD